jgi:rhodanese-related sulfurtransferase
MSQNRKIKNLSFAFLFERPMRKVFLSVLLLAAWFSCSPKSESGNLKTQESAIGQVINLNPKQFIEQSSGNQAILLDVRTAEEVAQGKIPNSTQLDYYQSNFLAKANELPKDQEIYIYCAVGARSREAAELLVQQGFTKVYHLQGGIQAWARAGLPIVR